MQIELKQCQKQILSQNMRQGLEVLQLNAQDLTEYINEAALENPVLELDSREESELELRLKKQEWLESLDEQNRAYYKYDWEDENMDRMSLLHADDENTLAEHLHLQLIGKNYSEKEMEILDFICRSLNSKGYFMEPVHVLCNCFQITEEEAQTYLQIIKSLEPTGVAASSLKECLQLQLKKMREEEAVCDNYGKSSLELACSIVQDCLELLGKNQLHHIAKQWNVTIDSVKQAAEIIKQLNPIPAGGFNGREVFRYVEPDIVIVKMQDHFDILLNNYSYPRFFVNKYYLEMAKKSDDKELRHYLNGKIKQTEKLQEAIQKRNSTLMELSKCILEKHKEFFILGKRDLKSFQMQEAAELLGVHESTVSRAVKDKYLQCCWGTFPMSYFFTRGSVQCRGNEGIVANQVKEKLKELIDREDKKKPYSDQKLTDLLNGQGIQISRRTVTKYREAMGMPNGSGRKIF